MSVKTKNEVARILGFRNETDLTTQIKNSKFISKYYDLVMDRIRLKEAFRSRGVNVTI